MLILYVLPIDYVYLPEKLIFEYTASNINFSNLPGGRCKVVAGHYVTATPLRYAIPLRHTATLRYAIHLRHEIPLRRDPLSYP